MTPSEIETLIGRVALGDRAAFRALYTAVSAKLFGICLRVLKDRGDAEEALQEAFVKIWGHAGRYQVSGYSPMTWLIAITRNQAIDRLRARRTGHAPIEAAETIADPRPTPEQSSVSEGEASRLRQCLDRLAPAHAEAVRAAYVEGYSYAELAERFSQPLNTIRSWLRRGLISLRECLGQ